MSRTQVVILGGRLATGPQVHEIISVGEFYEKAAGAQIVFT